MRSFFKMLIILAAGLVMSISCTPDACFEETNAYLKASLYDFETKLARPADSLTVYGAGMQDKPLYNKQKGVKPVLLPLDPSSPSCTFIIRINGISDTVKFTYTSYPHLISNECGYTFFHNIDTPFYTRHKIVYINTTRKNINTDNVENIRIFY